MAKDWTIEYSWDHTLSFVIARVNIRAQTHREAAWLKHLTPLEAEFSHHDHTLPAQGLTQLFGCSRCKAGLLQPSLSEGILYMTLPMHSIDVSDAGDRVQLCLNIMMFSKYKPSFTRQTWPKYAWGSGILKYSVKHGEKRKNKSKQPLRSSYKF